jgi:vacuolar-type H+-ATPase subunit I/STV1
MIQTYYTEERLIQVTDESDPYKPRNKVRVNEMTPEGIIINDLTLGEYDVIVGTAPARDNFDEMQFAEAIELRGVGVPIPDDMIVEYSHLSRKADIAERIRQMQGTAPPSEQQLQLQQFQMESQIRSTQLEIAKLEAEVTRLQTEAALNVAKTQSAEADPQLKVVEMQSKLQQKREELDLRERLSAMTNDMRKNQADAAIASKIAVAAMKPTGGKN